MPRLPLRASLSALTALPFATAAAVARVVPVVPWDIRAGNDMPVGIGDTGARIAPRRIVGRDMHPWQVTDGPALLFGQPGRARRPPSVGRASARHLPALAGNIRPPPRMHAVCTGCVPGVTRAYPPDPACTVWMNGPNRSPPSGRRARISTRSPVARNGVVAAPPSSCSIARRSAMQLEPTSA